MNEVCPGCGGPETTKNKVAELPDGRWCCSIWCSIRTTLREQTRRQVMASRDRTM